MGVLSDRNQQLIVREDWQLSMHLIALDTCEIIRQPLRQGKINGFVKIELKRRQYERTLLKEFVRHD